ncbi:MAG: cell division protein FtsX [Pseudomonadota bacterium]
MASETPLLPERDAREAALFFVVAALCFLAAIAGLSVKSTYSAAQAWTESVEGEYTIRLRDTDRRGASEAEDIISAIPGVGEARILSRDEINALLAPSFAGGELPAGLPMPLVMVVKTDTGAHDLTAVFSERLTEAGFDGVIDAHDEWAGDVRRALGVIRVVAASIVMLLAATALSVIAFATHAALLARRDIVDVLHLSGATDRFIAKLFERRFWMLGIRAGSVGALIALGGVALALYFASTHGTRTGLLPVLSLDGFDGLILVTTPLIAGLAARTAARITVMRALKASGRTAIAA